MSKCRLLVAGYWLLPLLLGAQLPAESWPATDDLGRTQPTAAETGPPRPGKFVGVFYFLWLGAHGHDQHRGPTPTEDVYAKADSIDYQSPYDISRILADNPDDPNYGPDRAFHHWGEPYFGYYLSDDEWVIARHAQLLADAAVDVVVFDITNAVVYLPIAIRVCKVFSRLRQLGWTVPKVAFLTNSKHVETTERLYADFYARGIYRDLWFDWKGKPLLMGNPEGLSPEVLDFFSFRRSWAWTEGQEWFGDGRDKWPWIDHYPQNYGWHDDPGTPEQIVVSTAQHPISNIGRSFHDGRQPPPDSIDPGAGLFFAEQWRRALEVDPEFVFITGWNEWVAMRFTDGKAKSIMGKPVKKGETYFVDQYNEEFSRDIEPMRGGFGDNYYYQMVDGIRRFKGARAAAGNGVVHRIGIDGKFDDWARVTAVYHDQTGDNQGRNHPGWGGAGDYVIPAGRDDLAEARVANDSNRICFYLRANNTLSELPVLYLSTGALPLSAAGYDLRIAGGGAPIAIGGAMLLERAVSATEWEAVGALRMGMTMTAGGTELEISLPRSVLPDELTGIDFKWAAGIPGAGADPMRFYDLGDAAPNARFNYHYELVRP